MGAFYLTVFALLVSATAAAQTPASPDELYQHRVDIPSAKQAADIWAPRAASGDYEAAWKLSRDCYWLGTAGPEKERHAQLARGIDAGKHAAGLEPGKPEGHFWYAANMGELAETSSFFTGLKYKGDIKTELQKVIDIAPGWQSGSAESALGQWYLKVPGFAGGDDTKGLALLRQALTYDRDSSQTKYTLAEALADNRKTRDEARELLAEVVSAPIDPNWVPEDQRFKAKAAALLARLNGQ